MNGLNHQGMGCDDRTAPSLAALQFRIGNLPGNEGGNSLSAGMGDVSAGDAGSIFVAIASRCLQLGVSLEAVAAAELARVEGLLS